MASERTLTVTGRFANVPILADFVAEAASDAGLNDTAIFHCRMSVDEACTNIIEHAYGGEDRGEIRCLVEIGSHSLTITLMDTGEGFDPTSVPTPTIGSDPTQVKTGGLGLHMMRKVMDEVSFTFGDEHNALVMVKRAAKPATDE